jgi:hypothetical protein
MGMNDREFGDLVIWRFGDLDLVIWGFGDLGISA